MTKNSMSLYELKLFTKDNNIEVTGDKRVKQSYVNAILNWQEDNNEPEITTKKDNVIYQNTGGIGGQQIMINIAESYLDRIQAKRDELGDYTSDIEDIAWLVDADDVKKNH